MSWGWVVRGEWVEKFYYSGEDGFRRLSTSRHNGLESRKMVWYVSYQACTLLPTLWGILAFYFDKTSAVSHRLLFKSIF